LLGAYVKESTKHAKNVRILGSTSELESLINTLVSQVTEEFVSELRQKASKYFFEEGNELGLFYKEHIRDKIKKKFGEQLSAIPKEGLSRENGTWFILEPVFVKKQRQRVFWVTPINVKAKLSKYQYRAPTTPIPSALILPSAEAQERFGLSAFSATTWSPPDKVEVADGESSFEVHWSVNVTQRKKLSSGFIDNIHFVSTNWRWK
jgi:hypothetical protein